MFKKILVATALVAVIVVLVFGAVNRTLAKNGSESISIGQGGYGRDSEEVLRLRNRLARGMPRARETAGMANAGVSMPTTAGQASLPTCPWQPPAN
jgi:hypothetical protein